jgi:hypothetical protein
LLITLQIEQFLGAFSPESNSVLLLFIHHSTTACIMEHRACIEQQQQQRGSYHLSHTKVLNFSKNAFYPDFIALARSLLLLPHYNNFPLHHDCRKESEQNRAEQRKKANSCEIN